MEIRKLKGKDIRVLAKIIGPEIGHLKTVTESANPTEVGLTLFENLLTKHVDELWEWLASLANMSADELDEAPVDTSFEIIRALKEGDEFRPLLDALFSPDSEDGKQSGTE